MKSASKQAGDNKPSKKLKQSFIQKYISSTRFIWYIFAVIARIVWTVVYPQQGYIHPVSEE
jgi:hypothetical protein